MWQALLHAPFDMRPNTLVHKIANCRVDIADDHEAESDLDFPRENIDKKEVEKNDATAVSDCFYNRSLCSGGSILVQFRFPHRVWGILVNARHFLRTPACIANEPCGLVGALTAIVAS
jgi:hypothetical protein